MAILKRRLNYNNAGTEEILHFETSSDLVKRGDGTDLEQAMTTAEAAITSAQAALTTLNGTGEGSVSKAVTDAVSSVVADSPEAFSTLKAFYDWTQTHETDALALGNRVTANANAINSLQAGSVKRKEITFTAANFSGGVYTIPAATHGLTSGAFVYQLFMNVNGVYTSGNWGTTEASVAYNADGSISITCSSGFAGKIVLIG